MADFIITNEPMIRLAAFAGVLAIMMVLQELWPRKKRVTSRLARWRTNSLLVVLNTLLIRLLGPITAVFVAGWTSSRGIGLFSVTSLALWVEIIAAVILLDLAVYFQHVAFHRVPMLWRMHKVHHADRDIDATTGIRFHPAEIVVSMLYKVLVILLLGPAVVAVILFEVLLNGSAMFNHANIALPRWLDSIMRTIIVTPDTHRVHHSVHRNETDSNYGFFLSVWDRIFKTYIAQPRDGHDAMTIGLPDLQNKAPSSLWWSITAPFRSSTSVRDMHNISSPGRLDR